MKVRIAILAACILLGAAVTLAHGGEEHVMGTVAKINSDSITVKTTASKMVTVVVAPETKFTRAKTTSKFADMSAGDRVVIHAKKMIDGSLTADTVEFAAAPTASARSSKLQTLTGVVSDSTGHSANRRSGVLPKILSASCKLHRRLDL